MTDQATTTPHVYAAVRNELIDGLVELDAAAASLPVPACPAWTVKDVVAHVTGLNAEYLAGLTGLGSDEATIRQVRDRATVTLADIAAEWGSLADRIAERFASDEYMASALLADLVVHVYDLVEVLAQPTNEAAGATPTSAHRYVPLLQQRLLEKMQIALSVELADGTRWPASEGEQAMTLHTDPHSFLRGVTGRLTRQQVEAFEWSADPTAILDTAWNQYGPFRVR